MERAPSRSSLARTTPRVRTENWCTASTTQLHEGIARRAFVRRAFGLVHDGGSRRSYDGIANTNVESFAMSRTWIFLGAMDARIIHWRTHSCSRDGVRAEGHHARAKRTRADCNQAESPDPRAFLVTRREDRDR